MSIFLPATTIETSLSAFRREAGRFDFGRKSNELIPQMVGAGALIKPLLGFSHATGVITVGAVVILIVTTAGMVSTELA